MDTSYLEELKKRGKESKVYKKYQMTGLEVAEILQDKEHKALYIKLAKEGDGDAMIRLAKDIAERKGVKNRGAYFMKLWHENHET